MPGFLKFLMVFCMFAGLITETTAFKCRSSDPWPLFPGAGCPSGFFENSGSCCPYSCKINPLPGTDGLCPVDFRPIIGLPGNPDACCPIEQTYKEDVSIAGK